MIIFIILIIILKHALQAITIKFYIEVDFQNIIMQNEADSSYIFASFIIKYYHQVQMHSNPFKNWVKEIQRTKMQRQAFGSASQRSIDKSSAFSNPGPGAYNPPLKDIQTTQRYHIRREDNCQQGKELMWIYGSNRNEGMTNKQNNKRLGPGAYEVDKEPKMNLKNSWSKASRFKTQPNSIDTQLPGPGYYNAHVNTDSTPCAKHVFNSKLQKSLFFSRERQNKKISSTEKLYDFEEEDPRYQSSLKSLKDLKKKQQKTSIFASKVPRFITDIGINDIGPGEYQIQDSNRSRIKSHLPQVIRFKQSKVPISKKKSTTFIGPGSYNMNKYTLSREIQFKGFPISRETRFNFSKKKLQRETLIPGPGSYMQKKYVFIDEKQIGSKKNLKKPQSTPQIHVLEAVKDTESRIYNIKCFDIQYRMRKQLQHRNRLKLMNISVPAFNSKSPRQI